MNFGNLKPIFSWCSAVVCVQCVRVCAECAECVLLVLCVCARELSDNQARGLQTISKAAVKRQ